MRAIENVFSWSTSRDGAFSRCAREYWWLYYGSWGGWSPDAQPEARQAYVLKNLTTRWAWVGSVVHETIEDVLRRLLRAQDPDAFDFGEIAFDVEGEVEAMTQRMREQYAMSRGGDYRRWPKKAFGLMEHEYADPILPAEWKAMSEKAREAVRAFLRSPLFETIRRSDPRTWFPIEEPAQFDFEGTPVWAVLDFAARRPDGGADLYDWKTGVVDPGANRLQLVCYALFMQAVHGVPAEKVHNHLVYLGREITIHDFVVTPKDVEEARHAIRRSVSAMRSRLLDPARNSALREAFPMTEDLSRCSVCAFRRLCGR